MDRKYLLPAILAVLSILFAVIAYRTLLQSTHNHMTSDGLSSVSVFQYLRIMEANKDNILEGEEFYAQAKAEVSRVIEEAIPYAVVSFVLTVLALWLFFKAQRVKNAPE